MLFAVWVVKLDAHNGGEHAVMVAAKARAGDKPLDLVNDLVLIADEREMVDTVELNKSGIGNLIGDKAALFGLEAHIARAVNDERRHPDRRQHPANVDLRVHLCKCYGRTGTGTITQILGPPGAECFVICH